MPELTESQRTQIAYQYFTLDEWKMMANAVRHRQAQVLHTKEAMDPAAVVTMLSKFPSAAL